MGHVTTTALPPLPGLQDHPHARAVLGPALAPGGEASHAYLFHGPHGAGKRTIARAFAAALLTDREEQASTIAERVARDAHPDLTWITPSGAREMLVGDVDEALIASIARTPFESARRVFVIEDAHTMNDTVANRLLKTLEEPPSFAHIILLARRPQDVPPTVASRCQAVRFEALAPEVLQERLAEHEGLHDLDIRKPDALLRLQACARLAAGDARLALRLAGEQGQTLRESAQQLVRDALWRRTQARQWLQTLQVARDAGTQAGARLAAELERELELMATKERRRAAREATEAQRRMERRERTGALEETLRLAELWLRDVWLVAEGAEELVYAVDTLPALREDAAGRAPTQLRAGVELIARTRLRLQANVAEELTLETLAYQLEQRLGSSDSSDSRAPSVPAPSA
jgi:DNA polymerase-3 subunit delta'